MSKRLQFLEFYEQMLEKSQMTMPKEVEEFYEVLKTMDDSKDKPLVTELGISIIQYAQTLEEKSFKSKDIAEGMGISAKRISGAMNKLVSDGYFEKVGNSKPIIYTLTEKGKNFINQQENENKGE